MDLTLKAQGDLHGIVPYGTNNHHIADAIFKAPGRSLAQAGRRDTRVKDVPSTKGVL